MDKEYLSGLLNHVKSGELSVDEAMETLKHFPSEKMAYAMIDHHRPLRRGHAEVIYGEGKTPQQILGIMKRLLAASDKNIIATRCNEETYAFVKSSLPQAVYYDTARLIAIERQESAAKGSVLVACAGTSDLPVAEEAYYTAHLMGSRVSRLYDVGVSGLHRLMDNWQILEEAKVIIVVAGMEGALASVIGGLVDKPVIAVPTSIGYGASFGGLAALLGMLNSCSSGVTVVNIDNGFGAGYAASIINAMGE